MKNQNENTSIIKFLTAQTISLLGSSLVQYAIIWYITINTSSGKMLMISTFCGFIPQIIISLFAGSWIDRYNRKKLIMLSDSMIALATLVLAIAFLLGYKSFILLFAVLVVRSIGTGIQTPLVNAIIPQIVSKEKLMKINGINSTISSLTLFLSPALSGAILSIAPLEVTLLIDVITALIGIGITSTIYISPLVVDENKITNGLIAVKEGFCYLKNNRFVKRLIIFQFIILFSISPSAFLTPLIVSRTFGSEVWLLSVSEMTYSLGMILGGLLISTWGGFKNKITTIMLSGSVYGIMMIGLGASSIFIFYLICNTIIGITSPCYSTPITVSIQEQVEPQMQGRVFSFMQIAASCAFPLGMVLFGPLADFLPVQGILMGAGLFVLFLNIVIYKINYFEITKHPSL